MFNSNIHLKYVINHKNILNSITQISKNNTYANISKDKVLLDNNKKSENKNNSLNFSALVLDPINLLKINYFLL